MIGAANTAIKANECLACARTATFFCFHMLGLTGLDSELVDLPVVYRYLAANYTNPSFTKLGAGYHGYDVLARKE